MIIRIIVIASISMLSAVSSFAQHESIAQLYRDILAQSSSAATLKNDGIFSKVNEVTVGAAKEAEINTAIPLALQCVNSTDTEVRKSGFVLLIAIIMRPDSAKLLGPYVDDLGKLLDDIDNAPRRTVFYLLGSMKPESPAKAIAYLQSNLENSRNSNKEMITVALSLLEAAPADASTLHNVLLVASSRSDAGLTNSVIRQLGLSKIQLPEAIDFISVNLNQKDPGLRASAVDAVSRLDKDKIAQFSSQLLRIASDPAEDKYVRGQAASALKQ